MGNHPTKHSKDRPKKNVHWKSAEPPSSPGRPSLVPGTEEAPDVVKIRWERPKYDGGSPITGYVVEHRRTGSPHWVKATPLLVPYLELSLGGLEPGWRYQFRVIAENAVGKSEPSELSDPLTVTLQRNPITAPHFTTELRDTIAIENEKVEFKVNVIGTPTPQVSWFKDGFEMFSSRRTKITRDNTFNSLIIHQAALTDEGEIKCTATNRAGHVVNRAKLVIEAPPKIRLPRQYEDGLIIEADEIVRLKVGTAGRPDPQIIWYHNGEVLTNDERHEIVSVDKHTSLKIANSRRSDRGEYQIKAVNKLGADNASFLVTVTSKPEPPGKVNITMSLGKTVSLSWSTPLDDGGCKIGNYTVEYFRQGWNVWLKAATTRQLTTTLNDLIEGSEYKFRVKAENPYGLSEPSDESDVISIPGPKRDSTLNVYDIESNGIKDHSPKAAPRRKQEKPDVSPQRSRKSEHLSPNLFDSGNYDNELSYGTSDALYKSRDSQHSSHSSKESFKKTTKEARKPIAKQVSFDRQFEARNESNNNLLTPRTDNEDNIHNSSEFVLVLYPEKENEVKPHHSSSFDLSMENSIAPPLSLSAPDLSIEPPAQPTLRRSVSSTELLYERAMSRLYQAIAYEESEKAKNTPSIVIHSEEDEIPDKSLLEEEIAASPTAPMAREEILEEDEGDEEEEEHDASQDEENFEEDYTDSTASSEESETEQFKRAVQSASLKPKFDATATTNELDTYHPSDMQPRTVTTYRSSDPNQAIEILTRPLPLPNPNFVPKPILKRPKAQPVGKEPKQAKAPQKRRILKQLFDRDKKNAEEKPPEDTPPPPSATTTVSTKKLEQSEKQKRLLAMKQDSLEEEKVVINHYSDIVREMGATAARKVPLYLSPQNLTATDDEEEELQQQKQQEIPSPAPSPTPLAVPAVEVPKDFFSSSPLVQRKYSKPDIFAPAPATPSSPPPLEIENEPPRISRKLVSETNERKPRGQTTSKERNRSRSNSGLRLRQAPSQPNAIKPPSPSPRIPRSRNTSQSPVVKNRLRLDNNKMVANNISPSPSPQQTVVVPSPIETEQKVKSVMTYFTDLALLFIACWLYFFKDARLAVPVILLIVYRQLSDVVKRHVVDHLPGWITGDGTQKI